MLCRTTFCFLLLTAVATATPFSSALNAQEQEHLIDGAGNEAGKVIQLRTRIAAEAEPSEQTEEVSSRSERLAVNPIAEIQKAASSSTTDQSVPQTLVGAPSVAYEEISERPMTPAANTPMAISPRVAANVIADQMQVPENATASENKGTSQKQIPSIQASHTMSPVGSRTPLKVPVTTHSVTPVVVVDIKAPEFVNVNEAATVTLDIRNPGKTALSNVKLIASIPDRTDTSIESEAGSIIDGECLFTIESLMPGETQTRAMKVTSTSKEPLLVQTAVLVSSESSINVDVRQPQLAVSVEGPPQTNIGTTATHIVTVENTGDGIARQISIEAEIPEDLKLIQKDGFETPLSLAPGEKAMARIVTIPQAAGISKVSFSAVAVGCNAEPASTNLKVTQPELRVDVMGPEMNFVERDGVYSINLNNPGEVDIHNVSVEFAIPEGIRITTISRQAAMDQQHNTLKWNFDEIKSQTQQVIHLKAIAGTEGEKLCRIRVASDETTAKEFDLRTLIATRADLSIQMQNVGGPLKVGSETTFVVIVENRGDSVANDMQIEVQLPSGMKPADPKDGVTDEESNSILFADSGLKPGDIREFKFSAKGVEQGEHIVRSSLQTAGSRQRVIVENSVYVYQPTQARVSESLSPAVIR